MPKEIIFISSVQKEFAKERQALTSYIREDELLKLFFEPYLFEKSAAAGHTPGTIYLHEVKRSAIYLGLLGNEYGYEDNEGVSPTEREFDQAQLEGIPCWVFISGNQDSDRHIKEQSFIRKVGELVSRKRFDGIEDLKKEVYKSCILYLKQTGKIDSEEFDSALHKYATLEDVSDEALSEFVRMAKSKRNFPLKENDPKEKVLTHLNLYRQGKLTNSALLAYARKPQSFFPSATIKCAHFHGLSIEKPIPDYKEFGGTVFQMADDALDFVLSKISLSTGDRSKSNLVETSYEIPRAVIAEGIINAIAHRDYFSKGSVQIAVFKDRVEIENPGSLPMELDIAQLKEPHSSYPKNPLLANCMFLTGAIERYGTGIPEMFLLSTESGLKSPDFKDDKTFSVTLWRPSAGTGQDTGQAAGQVTGQVTGQVQFFNDLTEPERVILVLEGEMMREELMSILELRHRDNFMEKYLNPSIAKGWVERTIPDKPTSSKQRYRLTKLGKDELKNIKKK